MDPVLAPRPRIPFWPFRLGSFFWPAGHGSRWPWILLWPAGCRTFLSLSTMDLSCGLWAMDTSLVNRPWILRWPSEARTVLFLSCTLSWPLGAVDRFLVSPAIRSLFWLCHPLFPLTPSSLVSFAVFWSFHDPYDMDPASARRPWILAWPFGHGSYVGP